LLDRPPFSRPSSACSRFPPLLVSSSCNHSAKINPIASGLSCTMRCPESSALTFEFQQHEPADELEEEEEESRKWMSCSRELEGPVLCS
jgi:hypothetical protein